MKSYRSIVFDLDGTLVDSYEALATAINHTRSSLEQGPVTVETIRGFVGDGVEKLLERALGADQVTHTARTTFEQRYDEVCCEQSRMLEEVEETLSKLEAMEIVMSVCTNKPTGFSEKILAHLGIARHFQAIVGPDLAGTRKPDGRHVLATIERAGGDPGSSLFVGDMPVDVEAARNAGIDVAVIATGSSSPELLREASPDYFLESFAEIIGIVSGHA